jgi:hypothetical protein
MVLIKLNKRRYVEIEDVVSSVKMLAAKYDFKFGGVAGWEYVRRPTIGPLTLALLTAIVV